MFWVSNLQSVDTMVYVQYILLQLTDPSDFLTQLSLAMVGNDFGDCSFTSLLIIDANIPKMCLMFFLCGAFIFQPIFQLFFLYDL